MGPLVAEYSIPLKSNKSPATNEFSVGVSVVFLAVFFRTGFAGGAFLDTFEAAGATKDAVDTLLEACLVDDGKDGGGFGTGAKDLLLVAGILYLYAERNRQKSNLTRCR